MDKINFDIYEDEKKQFTRDEFVQIMKELTDDYCKDVGGKPNEWQSQSHTFDEWFGSFVRWKSF